MMRSIYSCLIVASSTCLASLNSASPSQSHMSGYFLKVSRLETITPSASLANSPGSDAHTHSFLALIRSYTHAHLHTLPIPLLSRCLTSRSIHIRSLSLILASLLSEASATAVSHPSLSSLFSHCLIVTFKSYSSSMFQFCVGSSLKHLTCVYILPFCSAPGLIASHLRLAR